MATLYVAEFQKLGDTTAGHAQIADAVTLAEQIVAIGGASVASAAFQQTTRFIRVHTDAICSINVGPAPVATTSKMRFTAGQTEYFGVTGGDKIAVISNV
jgi:hypothetical protein